MKKIICIGLIATIVLSLVSCKSENYDTLLDDNNDLEANIVEEETLEIKADTVIDMGNIDTWIVKDARFIDVRDSEDMFSDGYIQGFEVVPFFDYLEGLSLVRNNDWNYSSEDLISEESLVNIFGEDKENPIILMCDVGTRSSYVASALKDIGYTNVHDAGGFESYNGKYKVEGNPNYKISFDLPTLEGVEVSMKNIDDYLFRPKARYIDVRNFEDMFSDGYIQGFEVVPFYQYLENRALVRNDEWNYSAKDLLDADVLINVFGDFDSEIFLMCRSGTRAEYVKLALEDVGYTNVHNVGGIKDYNGKYKINGIGEYSLEY